MLRDKEVKIQMQFLEQAAGYLNILETALLEVKINGQIALETINDGLRATHSIKGGASMLGFRILGDLAHRLEDGLQILKSQNQCLEIDADLQSLLLSGVDWLRQIVKMYSKGYAVDEQWLATFCYPLFEELQERLRKPSMGTSVNIFSTEHRLRDIIPLLFQTEIEECLQRLESLIENCNPFVLRQEVATMATELGDLGEMLQLKAFTQLCKSIVEQIEKTFAVEEIARLALKVWRRFQTLILTNQINTLPTKITSDLHISSAQQPQSSIQFKTRPLSDIVEHFSRALHDLCVEYGKNVQLRIEGANIQIEHNLLEALNQPLTHLIRNAFDHGIEDPATRRACGKPEQGLIEIKVTQQSHHIMITVRDDGRGISLDKIRTHAVILGLEPALLAEATDEELLSLIFEPGFSTANQVTMLSGRGVGMDVVRHHLTKVRGDIKVDTVLGAGTTFTLCVPHQLNYELFSTACKFTTAPITTIAGAPNPVSSTCSTIVPN